VIPERPDRPARAERALVLFLRFEAAILLLATAGAFLPTAWMRAAWDVTGLGPFPAGPLTEYLTRSLSALYALGGLFHLYVSFDPRRYLPLIVFVAVIKSVFGAGMIVLDLWAGLPWYWAAAEGPGIVAFGAVQYLLARRVSRGWR
jgi:hypothetical protein